MDEILAALESIENNGTFFSKRNINLNEFDIKFNKVGALTFPMSEPQIKELIKLAKPAQFGWKDQTILDEGVRKVWEIAKSKVKIGKKQWSKKFDPLLLKIKDDLGLPKKSKLKAELHNMLIYEPGCFFKPHQDSEKANGMVATMVVILPTRYTGGELIVTHQGTKKTFKLTASDTNKLSCVSFYADCYHEVRKVETGYRISLTYNLLLENYRGEIDTLYEADLNLRLKKSLRNYFYSVPKGLDKPRKFIYLLEHQYTQKGLSWQQLKSNDRVTVDGLLKAADDLDLEAHLALADMQETWECEFDYHDYRYRGRHHYDDDDEEGIPDYILCTDTVLRHWVNRSGKHVAYKDFSPSDNEVCWIGENEGFEPFQSEYEPWMGNYGNTLDRWYHRAAIVLWKKDDHYPFLFEVDKESYVKEIFTLMDSDRDKSKLHAMLKHTAPYWHTYARKHNEKQDITNAMKLALYLNDQEISSVLFQSYEISFLSVKNVKLWAALVDNYGTQWCLNIFDVITNQENRGTSQSIIIKDFSKLIRALSKHSNCHEVITWLMNYQFMCIKSNHCAQVNSGFYTEDGIPNRINEATDFILGTIVSKNKSTHSKMLKYIMKNEDIYPQLLLVELFEKCMGQLKGTEAESLGYKDFLNYVYVALSHEHQLGLRSIDDWSINEKSSCTCPNCKILNVFLADKVSKKKIWPLSGEKRHHIKTELDKLRIPVNDKVEETGRPYKLILRKTLALYDTAKNRYEEIGKAIDRLAQVRIDSPYLCVE